MMIRRSPLAVMSGRAAMPASTSILVIVTSMRETPVTGVLGVIV
jgi:hypothetical protein